MKALTAPLTELGSFQQILEGIAKGNTPVFATGVIDAAKNHLAYSLQAETKRPLFLLTYSELAREGNSGGFDLFYEGLRILSCEGYPFLQRGCA